MLPSFSYVRVNSLEDAIYHLSAKDAYAHAGGVDLLGCLRDGVFTAAKLVSLSKLDDLQGISDSRDGGLRIGALTTVNEVAKNQAVNERYSGLALAASQVGTPQLRNQGTIGGNICQRPRCWYYRGDFHCLRKGGELCYAFGGENQFHGIFGSDKKCCMVHPSDIAAALVAFDAQVKVAGPEGNRVVPLEKFHVSPGENVERETVLQQGEIVTDIVLPPPASGMRSSYRKVSIRKSWDFAIAGVALALVMKGNKVERGRVVLSGAAPIPWRSSEVEAVITDKALDAKTIALAVDAVARNAEPLSKNEYKIPLFKAIMGEELTAIVKG
jgi:xanthine dehydrogenase YagS FAD-binding subunit